MSIFTTIEGDVETDFEAFWANVQGFFSADVAPAVKSFLQVFSTTFGQQALTAALATVGSLATGTTFTTAATGLATTLLGDAKTDAASEAELSATQMLQTIQSALQVAKVANNVVTPSDQQTAASLPIAATAPTPAA